MATENITYGVLVIASEEIGPVAEAALGAGALRAKAVTGARQALGAIGGLNPHFIVIEAGHVPVPAMQAVKNMAELAAGRPVSLLMICGPLDEAVEKQRAELGITTVLDKPYSTQALVDTIKAAIEKLEQARKDSQMRKSKQVQIQERLRTASNKYAAMSEAAARERLNMPQSEPVQDFASDDAAPPVEPDPNKPPDEPTWDGDRKSRS